MRKEVQEAAEEIKHWFASEDPKYFELVAKILASVPGGDRFEDLGYEPFTFLGWKEFEMLGDLMVAIKDRRDVEDIAELLLNEEEED